MSRFEINFLTDYTDDALLDELRRVAALLPADHALTKTTYERHSPRVAHTTIRRRFGGWKEALEKAGLGHLYSGQPVSKKMRTQPAKSLSNEDLVAEMKRVHAIVGKEWLTSDDFNTHSVTSKEAIRRRFGSFRKGLETASIPHSPVRFVNSLTSSALKTSLLSGLTMGVRQDIVRCSTNHRASKEKRM